MSQADVERFEEHLPYEINMLRGTYSAIARVPGRISDQVTENALIESFCIHARALFEFFHQESGSRPTYVTSNYCSLGSHDKYRVLLNNQIAHVINDKRVIDKSRKIGSQIRFDMYKAARDEIEKFRAHLKPGYAADKLPELPNYLAAPSMNSATNAIQMSTLSISYDPNIATPQTFQLSISTS